MKDIKTRELQTQEAVKNRGKYQEELRKAQSITTEDFAKTACIAQASQLQNVSQFLQLRRNLRLLPRARFFGELKSIHKVRKTNYGSNSNTL